MRMMERISRELSSDPRYPQLQPSRKEATGQTVVPVRALSFSQRAERQLAVSVAAALLASDHAAIIPLNRGSDRAATLS
jgi:hypothetical protein